MICSSWMRRHAARLALALCIVAGSVLALLPPLVERTPAQAASPTWKLEAVDASGARPSLACDSRGTPAIASVNFPVGPDLTYARWNGLTWDVELVDSSPGDRGFDACSLQFDRNDSPAIAYTRAEPNSGLKYAHWNGAAWDLKLVDGAAHVSTSVSLAFSPSGDPAIAYTDNAGIVSYARYTGASWDVPSWDVMKVDSGYYGSLAFGPDGNPALSYRSGYQLKYAAWDGSSWNMQTLWDGVNDKGVRNTSLAFAPDGSPAVAFVTLGSNFSNSQQCARWNGSSWDVQTVHSGGRYGSQHCAMGFDPGGNPVMAWDFEYSDSSKIHYAQWNGAGWQVTEVGDGWCVGGTLVFDSRGSPAMAYGGTYAYLSANEPPGQPVNSAPGQSWMSGGLPASLQATAFSDPDPGDAHLASRWQVSMIAGVYTNPAFDSGWDTSNLTSATVPSGVLAWGGRHYWRVMYKDNHGTCSPWSAETHFYATAGMPQVEFTRLYETGAEVTGCGLSVAAASDGGCAVMGNTMSLSDGSAMTVLMKVDAEGEPVWRRTFQGSGNWMEQTSDGGYIIVGGISPEGGGAKDVWLLKTDSEGGETWSRTFGWPSEDWGNSVRQTSDGGYIIAGWTNSYGFNDLELFLIRTDPKGERVWDRTYGGPEEDWGCSVQQTPDGGYITVGSTSSYGDGGSDLWLVKTDSGGEMVWDKTFGGSRDDTGWAIAPTSHGEYIVAGQTSSHEGGDPQLWLLKTDSNGNAVWDETYGGPYREGVSSVQETLDGGYIAAGYTEPGNGVRNVWLLKADSKGRELWSNDFGGPGDDAGHSVRQVADGGYVVVGCMDFDGSGKQDIYLLKISDQEVELTEGESSPGQPGWTWALVGIGSVLAAGAVVVGGRRVMTKRQAH